MENMDIGHVKRVFFSKISQVIARYGQMGGCRVFGVFSVELSAQILSLCVPKP